MTDGHDPFQTWETLARALLRVSERPCLVVADTVAGKGVSFM